MQYRWIIFISSVVLTFTKFLIEVSYGRTIIDLQKTFPNATMATLQWTGSMVSGIENLFTWQVLILVAIYGYRWTVRIGVILGAIALVLASFSTSEYQLLMSYGILFGYGGVFLVNVGLFLVAAHFPPDSDYHVFATSFKLSIYPLAVAAIPIFSQMLITWGWRVTYIIYACVILVIGLAVSTVFGRIKESVNNEKDKGTKNEQDFQKEIKIKMYIIIALKTLSCFFKALHLNVPIYILPKHSHQLGFTLHQGSSLVSYFGMAEACTRLATAFLGDRFFKKRLLYLIVIGYCLGAVVNALLGYTATTYTSLILYSVTMGALTGPVMAAFYALCAEILLGYYTNEIYSACCFAWGIGFMVGMLIDGLIFDITSSFQDVYLLMAAMQTIVALLLGIIILLRRNLHGFLVEKKIQDLLNTK